MASRPADALRDLVAPALGLAPGDLELVEFADGVASVRLSAGCQSCPASLPRFIAEIEEELRRHVPEVEIVELLPPA